MFIKCFILVDKCATAANSLTLILQMKFSIDAGGIREQLIVCGRVVLARLSPN